MIAKAVEEMWSSDNHFYVATDGGAKVGVASWGISICGRIHFGGRTPTADQSSFLAELYALWMAVGALQRALECTSSTRHITIVVDCLGAQEAAEALRDAPAHYGIVREIRDRLRHLRGRGKVDIVYVPSHGKYKAWWTPRGLLTEKELRRANGIVDRLASQALRRALEYNGYRVWLKEKRDLEKWGSHALELAGLVRKRYMDFLDALVAHKEEEVAGIIGLDDPEDIPVIFLTCGLPRGG